MVPAIDAIQAIARRIYGPLRGDAALERIENLIKNRLPVVQPSQSRFSQADTVLITYGDTLRSRGRAPLLTLHDFADRYLRESFSAIHFLPFFPFSSDDGFSVIDYMKINPELGTWQDVERFSGDFDLMFDYVLNHVSAKGPWFESYLAGRQGFRDLAIEVSPQTDLSLVTRPRALPLLTPFTKASGEQVHLWTTFSEDQIDLNYESLDVLEKMVEVLLFYVSKGAKLIRMDAVAYLWKQIGTTCIHLPQAHGMVQLFRAILDRVAPDVIIITETNVPHRENVSYFGDGRNEAQMVYNFTLPPMLMHTFLTADSDALVQWAQTLSCPSDQTTFFNFTASHDGIGVRPLEGILSSRQIGDLEKAAFENGGQVSYKHNSDGSQSPYEFNVTYIDALGGHLQKFLASQAIAMVLPGVPAIYIHSLLGSRNWNAGVEKTGRARTINRQPLNYTGIVDELGNSGSFRAKVFSAYRHMLIVRRAQPAFHPNAGSEVIRCDPRIFAIRRHSEDQEIMAVTNVGEDTVPLSLKSTGVSGRKRDLLSDQILELGAIRLKPYQVLWLVDHS